MIKEISHIFFNGIFEHVVEKFRIRRKTKTYFWKFKSPVPLIYFIEISNNTYVN